VRVHVAFTPAEAVAAPVGIVVDVLRATSTLAQALAAGYGRVLCCAEVVDAEALRNADGKLVLAGERRCVRIPGFDLGNSPQEFLSPLGESLVLTTTNGTRAILAAAERCERVLTGSLLNLGAVAHEARRSGEDVTILCAGVQGTFAMDDAYCAGRIVELLEGDASDGAEAAVRLARSYADAVAGLRASQSARNLLAAGLGEDIAWCARESVLDVVPRFAGREGSAAVVSAG
jgi:2-phosphosulfolactate phosphatase